MNNPERCKKIEAMIKSLSITQMEELFKILQKNKCEYTINNNGLFLNLSWISSSLLDKIELFINFCKESKKEIDKYELICKTLNDNFDTLRQEEKEVIEEPIIESPVTQDVKKIVPKISSSMKFYLLKKKFLKNSIPSIYSLKERDLLKEEYLLKN
jgi:hypothetical protein